jgi:hypothetical protein
MAKHKAEYPDPIEIDERHLDREWLAQPRLMRDALLRVAKAKQDEREAKAALELVDAELAFAIRRTPTRYGLESSARGPSNDVVAMAVIIQPEHRNALRAHMEAKRSVEILEAEVTALSHKKAALENAVILFSQGYGAECKLPRWADQPAKERMERVRGDTDFRKVTRPIEDTDD